MLLLLVVAVSLTEANVMVVVLSLANMLSVHVMVRSLRFMVRMMVVFHITKRVRPSLTTWVQ